MLMTLAARFSYPTHRYLVFALPMVPVIAREIFLLFMAASSIVPVKLISLFLKSGFKIMSPFREQFILSPCQFQFVDLQQSAFERNLPLGLAEIQPV